MRRREFITLLGGAATWPVTARAQQPALPVIGFLHSASPGPYARLVAALQQGLAQAGYVAGRNVAFEFRWADDQYDRLPALAADLVARQVTVIFANGPAALPAKAATKTIPIVFANGGDPILLGLVASLNRPGGNITGVTNLNTELGAKRLELLHEIVPAVTSFAMLLNPNSPIAAETRSKVLEAARVLGLQVHVLDVSTEREFDATFEDLVRLRVGALAIGTDAFLNTRSQQLATLATSHSIPAVSQIREFAAAGGLMSYGDSSTDQYRQVGAYIGRILKGEKPGDLPVQQSTKVELVVNLKTAKTLGLTVPLSLLTRADEVIE
jgi:putative ABC transport system substrate-binding protein